MIEFDIKTVGGRTLGKVVVTETRKYRNGKRYYDVEYTDQNTTHKARVLQAYHDGALVLIAKASKAIEKVRRAFYAFPPDIVTYRARQEDGAVCTCSEEDMAGNKTGMYGGAMPIVRPEDIPERYRGFVMEWMTGQGSPEGGIYLHDFNRWLGKQFVETVPE